jgi:hypothetical protein
MRDRKIAEYLKGISVQSPRQERCFGNELSKIGD